MVKSLKPLLIVAILITVLLIASCGGAKSTTTPQPTTSIPLSTTTPPITTMDLKSLDGKELYEAMCLDCHLFQCDAPGDISNLGLPQQLVTETIMWGTSVMPRFQDTFTMEQIYLVVAYVTGSSLEGNPYLR